MLFLRTKMSGTRCCHCLTSPHGPLLLSHRLGKKSRRRRRRD